MVVFSVTAKLIIGLVQPVSTGLIAANSLSRCISPHAHMEEIKPAKLIQTANIFFLHCFSAYTCFCVHVYIWVCSCVCACTPAMHPFYIRFVFPSFVRLKGGTGLLFSSSPFSLCPHDYIIEKDSSQVCCRKERERGKEWELCGRQRPV